MAKQFFKDLPDTTTPLTATRLNGLLDGEEAMGNLVVDSIKQKNMFDGTTTYNGYLKSDGTSTSSSNWRVTDFIPIIPSKTYISRGPRGALGETPARCYYDSSKTFISGIAHNNDFIFKDEAPSNAYYMKESFRYSTIDGVEILSQNLDNTNYENEEIVVGSIRTKNMLNPDELANGKLSNTTGEWSYANNAITTDFIPVRANKTYTIALNNVTANQFLYRVVIYDTSKAYSSTPLDTTVVTTYSFTPTINGYARLSFSKGSYAQLIPNDIITTKPQMEEGSTATPYMPFQNINSNFGVYIGTGFLLYKIGNMVFCSLDTGGTAVTNGIVISIPEGYRCASNREVKVYTKYYDGSNYVDGYFWVQNQNIYIRTVFSNTPASASYFRGTLFWELRQ